MKKDINGKKRERKIQMPAQVQAGLRAKSHLNNQVNGEHCGEEPDNVVEQLVAAF